VGRYRELVAHWPALARHLPRHFDVLADYDDADYQRLGQLLTWITANPDSNLYPRQLPIGGLDSKWLERRKRLAADLVAAIQDDGRGELDFYVRCGLKRPPHPIRMRVLDPVLRGCLGGLGDISAPVEELAALDVAPAMVFIVENLQTALAFSDLPGAVVFMRLGYHVGVLGEIPWISRARCIYWGDVDTHGFAILSRARGYLPGIRSVLMDEETLLGHCTLWVKEDVQSAVKELALLTEREREVYVALKQHRWGEAVRLEQERIPWDVAWSAVSSAATR
jgi:hypothetical protein